MSDQLKMEIDNQNSDYSYISIPQIKPIVDQLSLFSKIINQNETLSNLIIFPHKSKPDYIIKIPNPQLAELKNIISILNFQSSNFFFLFRKLF